MSCNHSSGQSIFAANGARTDVCNECGKPHWAVAQVTFSPKPLDQADVRRIVSETFTNALKLVQEQEKRINQLRTTLEWIRDRRVDSATYAAEMALKSDDKLARGES